MAKKPRRSNEVSVVVGGAKRRLHLNAWGLILAMEKGFDPSMLGDAEALDENDDSPEASATRMKILLRLVWLGMLPYEPDLGFEDMCMSIELDELPGIRESVQKAQKRQSGGMPDPLAKAAATVAPE